MKNFLEDIKKHFNFYSNHTYSLIEKEIESQLLTEFKPTDWYGEKYLKPKWFEFDTAEFPLIRNVFSKTLFEDIVSVFPMREPSSDSLFTMEYCYSIEKDKNESKKYMMGIDPIEFKK